MQQMVCHQNHLQVYLEKLYINNFEPPAAIWMCQRFCPLAACPHRRQ